MLNYQRVAFLRDPEMVCKSFEADVGCIWPAGDTVPYGRVDFERLGLGCGGDMLTLLNRTLTMWVLRRRSWVGTRL